MWTSPSSSNSIPSSCAILGNHDSNSTRSFPKSMEEIWKDITLSSLHQQYHPSRGIILQDFFSKDPHQYSSSPPPPPPTMLTLSSPLGPLHPQDQYRAVSDHVSPLALPPFEDQNPGCGKKRFPDSDISSGDRRHKRMIKNRESAARSRARKQAYTNELEMEVAHLLEENARLKKQQQQSTVAAAADYQYRYGKKKPLQRTSTAPF